MHRSSHNQTREMGKLYVSIMVQWLILFHFFHLAVSVSLVKFLPGFEGPLPFELETGYVGVGESEDVQLFYYFIKSERNPKEDPLMIWLSGGPACSSICGMLYENGPLAFKEEEYNGGVPTLVSTSFSWTKEASILFLDSPAGSGFSYARTSLAFHSSDTKQIYQIDQFLRKWLVNRPDYVSNPFYVGGDSYAGKIVPGVVQQILHGNEKGVTPLINIQGYVAGNPLMEAHNDYNHRIPFAYGMGLISDELYESLKRSCGGEYTGVDPNNSKCLSDLQAYKEVETLPDHAACLNMENILLRDCEVDYVKPPLIGLGLRIELKEPLGDELSLPPLGCFSYRYFLSAYWANDETVRRALHVKRGTIGKWKRCNTENVPYVQDITSSFPHHLSNSVKGVRSLIYSGDHDLMIPSSGTQAWIRALNYSIVDDWRPWTINDQVAGYTRTYSNRMTFATVKGGGHTADYKPDECSVMFKRWIRGEPL